jgi:short-subunit dehydrogenase
MVSIPYTYGLYADSRLVTGGSSGLGAATAIRFANSGARVVVADLKSAGIEKQITDKHGKDSAIFVKVDVTKEDEIENSTYLNGQGGSSNHVVATWSLTTTGLSFASYL